MDWLKDAIESLGDSLSKLLSGICNGWFANLSQACVDTGVKTYNELANKALALLTQSPQTWSGGNGWNFVKTFQENFTLLAMELVIVFYLIGFFTETIDIKANIRLETFLLGFIKIFIAEVCVSNSMTIMSYMFLLVTKLVGSGKQVFTNFTLSLNFGAQKGYGNLYDYFGEEAFGCTFLTTLATIVFFASFLICGGYMVYFAFIRFFKIICIVPYGALAASTIAGTNTINSTFISFIKFSLATVLEAVTAIIAIRLFGEVGNTMTFIDLGKTLGNNWSTFSSLLNSIIVVFIGLGAVKGSSTLTQRVLGL